MGGGNPAGSQSLIRRIRIKKQRGKKRKRGRRGKSEKHVHLQLSANMYYCLGAIKNPYFTHNNNTVNTLKQWYVVRPNIHIFPCMNNEKFKNSYTLTRQLMFQLVCQMKVVGRNDHCLIW